MLKKWSYWTTFHISKTTGQKISIFSSNERKIKLKTLWFVFFLKNPLFLSKMCFKFFTLKWFAIIIFKNSLKLKYWWFDVLNISNIFSFIFKWSKKKEFFSKCNIYLKRKKLSVFYRIKKGKTYLIRVLR